VVVTVFTTIYHLRFTDSNRQVMQVMGGRWVGIRGNMGQMQKYMTQPSKKLLAVYGKDRP